MGNCILCSEPTSDYSEICNNCFEVWSRSTVLPLQKEENCQASSEVLIQLLNITNLPSGIRHDLTSLVENNNVFQCIDEYYNRYRHFETIAQQKIIKILTDLTLNLNTGKTIFYRLIQFNALSILMAKENEQFRNQLQLLRDDQMMEIGRLKHRAAKVNKLKNKLKRLKIEMTIAMIIVILSIIATFFVTMIGLEIKWLTIAIILVTIIFAALKFSRYSGINLDFSYQPWLRYRIDELEVPVSYINTLEEQVDRTNNILSRST